MDEDASLEKLKYLARNLPSVPLNAEQNVDFNKQLNALEKAKDKELLKYLKKKTKELQDEVGAKTIDFSKEEGNVTAIVKTQKAEVKTMFSKA